MIFSGLLNLLDDSDFLSSENLHDVLVSDLISLVLLAVALFFLVGDDLFASFLANLDDRGNLDKVFFLLFHFFL